MRDSKYRPDIDGLRTIAVGSVVLFHAGFPVFSGGFVGVDIFFVISGYLITRLIVDEVERTGRFDFSNFYIRRVRRLFPAMFVMLAVTFVGASLLFSPDDMTRFAGSLVHSILSVSNYFFWWESGYFDADSRIKPLLHTWSLAVEEQFYLIWPLCLVFLARRHSWWVPFTALAVAGLVSVAVTEWVIFHDASAAFYWLPFRVCEFAAGALLVWLIRLRVPALALEPILLLGFALMVFSIFAFTERTRFPGLHAMVPCIGAALAIYAGQARLMGVALRNPVSVFIGKISYSVYLIHWPLIVLWENYTAAPIAGWARFAIVALTLVLATLSWRFVERPFRFGRTGQTRFALVSIALGMAVLYPAITAWASNGWTWRIPATRSLETNGTIFEKENGIYCSLDGPRMSRSLFTCQNYRGSDKDIFILGDSHARHLIAGVSDAFRDHNVYVIGRFGCLPEYGIAGFIMYEHSRNTQVCLGTNANARKFLAQYKPSKIIISHAKRETPGKLAPPLNELIAMFEASGHSVAVLGDFIRPGKSLVNCLSAPAAVSDEALASRCATDPDIAAEEMKFNDEMAKLVRNFVPVNDVQCPGGECQFTSKGLPLFRDSHHLSIVGSRLLVSRVQAKRPIWK